MKLNKILKNYNIKPIGYEKNGKIIIIKTTNNSFVYKEGKLNNQIFDYLKSRNYEYFPHFLNNINEEYQLTQYIDSLSIPDEQKIIDLIKTVALLHSKTTHYKEIDLDYYEKIYEDLNNNINYLYTYYTDIITIIESKVYMSPSQYLFARNISIIYKTLNQNKEKLDNWYNHIKEKTKERRVIIHNNLALSHFIISDKPYLTSWDKAKIASPVFDLYKLYLNHALDFDFETIIKTYEKHYPLLEDEKELFYILITQPILIDFKLPEYQNCKKINKMINIIIKANELSKHNLKNTKT